VDPTRSGADGIFFVESSDLSKIFPFWTVGHFRQDYQTSWFDIEDDSGQEHSLFFDIIIGGQDLYVQVESYMVNSIPSKCFD
jgi:hypothetical protein